MAYNFQVTVDASAPHMLADWWAEALGWVVEPSNEAFIRAMIAEGHAADGDTTTHHGVLVWKDGAAIRHPGDAPPAAVPDGDTGETGGPRPEPRRVLFQLVPEPKTVKNRIHLDIWVGEQNVEAELAALASAGARFLHRARQGPHSWVTMADPEGNEFCIS